MEVSGQLAEGWRVHAGYTLNNSKYLAAANTQKGTNYSKHTLAAPFSLVYRSVYCLRA